MRTFRILNAKIKRIFPFLLILLVMSLFHEQEQSSALRPPKIRLIAMNMRTADDTDFTLPDVQGNSVHIADLKGNVILLNFFATWCPPCRKEMSSIDKLYQKYIDQGFIVLGVAGDFKGEKVINPFIDKHELTFPILLDTQNSVFRQYLVRGIPTTYLLDRQGRIAGKITGGFDWNSKEAHTFIEQLLQEPKST